MEAGEGASKILQSHDSGAVFDAHVRTKFVERDVDATSATMTDALYVTHIRVMLGGWGATKCGASTACISLADVHQARSLS
jgi:hypothetical protein